PRAGAGSCEPALSVHRELRLGGSGGRAPGIERRVGDLDRLGDTAGPGGAYWVREETHMATVKSIPAGYHTVTPYLVVEGAAKVIDFAKQAFGAEELNRMATPDGTIMHAEIKIGDSRVMLGEAQGPWKPMPTTLYLYLPDVDA